MRSDFFGTCLATYQVCTKTLLVHVKKERQTLSFVYRNHLIYICLLRSWVSDNQYLCIIFRIKNFPMLYKTQLQHTVWTLDWYIYTIYKSLKKCYQAWKHGRIEWKEISREKSWPKHRFSLHFSEGWKGLAMGQSILTHCGSWRFQVPTGKG